MNKKEWFEFFIKRADRIQIQRFHDTFVQRHMKFHLYFTYWRRSSIFFIILSISRNTQTQLSFISSICFYLKSKHGRFYWIFTSCEVADTKRQYEIKITFRSNNFKGFSGRERIVTGAGVFLFLSFCRQINNKRIEMMEEKNENVNCYWLLCIVSTFSLFAYFTLPSLFLFHPPTWIDPKCFVVCFLFFLLSFTASPKIEWNMREIEFDVFSSWFCCHHHFGNMMKSIPISFGCSHFKCLLI